ncbi:hypothetical protein SEA_WOLLYPOG_23 [Arthrobacter phage Wollypog]|uniref:Uncharacterized protein n=1 Tax=Arthrobacter phage Wollypog TaxID=2790985 RepID=A0A7T3KC68_9CAUD|nr:hol-like chemotaxis [Arthrobacter phage Wollypog]QPX62575.1 hypothetical protein SEA_WOLLYPOG_23 [Arthrobacter phage Wollypog]
MSPNTVPPEAWDLIKVILTVGGGIIAAMITSRLTRTSQKESTQISLLTNLIDQVQEERDKALDREKASVEREKETAKQIPLWRRYSQMLRKQIYGLGHTPIDPDDRIEL